MLGHCGQLARASKLAGSLPASAASYSFRKGAFVSSGCLRAPIRVLISAIVIPANRGLKPACHVAPFWTCWTAQQRSIECVSVNALARGRMEPQQSEGGQGIHYRLQMLVSRRNRRESKLFRGPCSSDDDSAPHILPQQQRKDQAHFQERDVPNSGVIRTVSS